MSEPSSRPKSSRKTKTSSAKSSQPSPQKQSSPVSFENFTVKEDEHNSSIKNDIITQSTRIHEIVSDASKFNTYYNELVDNIVHSMNSMIDSYNKTGKKAIFVDIYEAVVAQTDWNELKERFKNDVVSQKPLSIPQYTSISTNLKKYKIDKYDTDVLVDMYSTMDEDTVRKFAKSQEDAVNNLYELVDNVTAFENDLCAYRTKTIETMKRNVETLYALHVNYAKALMSNSSKVPETVNINGKAIAFQKGQKPFICNALKEILLQQ